MFNCSILNGDFHPHGNEANYNCRHMKSPFGEMYVSASALLSLISPHCGIIYQCVLKQHCLKRHRSYLQFCLKVFVIPRCRLHFTTWWNNGEWNWGRVNRRGFLIEESAYLNYIIYSQATEPLVNVCREKHPDFLSVIVKLIHLNPKTIDIFWEKVIKTSSIDPLPKWKYWKTKLRSILMFHPNVITSFYYHIKQSLKMLCQYFTKVFSRKRAMEIVFMKSFSIRRDFYMEERRVMKTFQSDILLQCCRQYLVQKSCNLSKTSCHIYIYSLSTLIDTQLGIRKLVHKSDCLMKLFLQILHSFPH